MIVHLTGGNREVSKEFMFNESACKSFVQHLKFLVLKARKTADARSTLQRESQCAHCKTVQEDLPRGA